MLSIFVPSINEGLPSRVGANVTCAALEWLQLSLLESTSDLDLNDVGLGLRLGEADSISGDFLCLRTGHNKGGDGLEAVFSSTNGSKVVQRGDCMMVVLVGGNHNKHWSRLTIMSYADGLARANDGERSVIDVAQRDGDLKGARQLNSVKEVKARFTLIPVKGTILPSFLTTKDLVGSLASRIVP